MTRILTSSWWRRGWIAVITLLASLLPALWSSAAASPNDPSAPTERTRDQKLDLLRQEARATPSSAETWRRLGEALFVAGKPAEAIPPFRRAAAIERRSGDAWVRLGGAYAAAGYHKQALDSFRRAVKLSPADPAAWFALGAEEEHLNHHAQALPAFEKASRLLPGGAASYNLGIVYGELNRFQDAASAYRMALTRQPGNAEAWNNLGVAYEKLGRSHDALQAYSRAFLLQPNNPTIVQNVTRAGARVRSPVNAAASQVRRAQPAGRSKNVTQSP
ncbi:MAG: tetratricopeptide repeat protein [Methylacidiphilaceae bacterium]|nr:tetratricopeptide repeat protein [Candidatus Methylacidiphilaceae bacterium]